MRNTGVDYHPKFYGIALYKLLPNGKKEIISRRTLWHIYEFVETAKKTTPCFRSLIDNYTSSVFDSTEEYKTDLNNYLQGFKQLLNKYPKESEEYYEIQYITRIFAQANQMERMWLIITPYHFEKPFCPNNQQWFESPENSAYVFSGAFPAGILLSFIFGKITPEAFASEFEEQYNAEQSKKSFSKLIFTDKALLQELQNVARTFTQFIGNIETLQTKVAKLYGQLSQNATTVITTYFKLLIQFTYANTFWKINIPRTDIWYSNWGRYIFGFFPLYDLYNLHGNNFTWVQASCALDNNYELHLLINFINAQEMKKNIYEVDQHIEVDCHIKEYMYTTNMSNKEESMLALSFSQANVDFVNNQIYFIKDNKKIYGQEVNIADFTNTFFLPQAIYNLEAIETLTDKSLVPTTTSKYEKNSHNFSHFYFKFPLSSKDYDNTEFVLEGLSYQDKPLPPLKVHLNYLEAEESYEKTTRKEIAPDYFYEHGLALYKIHSEGKKELITKKLFPHYAKYAGEAAQTMTGFKEHFDYYKPLTLEITKDNHSILHTLLKETETLAKKHIEHTEISKEISELRSFLMLADSMESCFIYDSPDPYNDKSFLPNKIDASYIFDICPLEELVAQFLEKAIIKYDPEVQITTEDFVKEYKALYLDEFNSKFNEKYNYDDRHVLSAIYSLVNLYPENYDEKKLRAEVGKLFGLFSKIQPYTKEDYFKPIIQITPKSIAWELFTPSVNRWEYRFNRILLPTFFLDRGIEALPGYNYSWLFAILELEENKKLAIMVKFNDLPEKRKVVFDRPTVYEEYEFEKAGSDYPETTVTLSFTSEEVDFDNSKVYFIVNETKRQGKEVNTVFLQEEGCIELGEHVYTLNSHEVLLNNKVCLQIDEDYISPKARKNKEIEYEPYREKGPFVFSSYFFKFPVTCEEYENAEFIVDGLSYKGKALSPLRVRLNYS